MRRVSPTGPYAPANWCPGCQTVLANEQVKEGRCERSDDVVERRNLEQWFFRITDYAEELLDFGGLVDWPEKIKTMQRNWIGRSEGARLPFDLSHHGIETKEIEVFTTRPDTVYGVTFMALAPEHPLVEQLTAPERRAEVEAYARKARAETEIERMSTEREKTGVPIGADCVNPFNGERVPIYAADYVLLGYGTGAVMGVPAHDQRDFEFATKYGLPVRVVISPPDWDGSPLDEAYLDQGPMVNSGRFDGIPGADAFDAVTDFAEAEGFGARAITYRMRDWLISPQRYWGTPIPIIYCDGCGAVPVPEEQLPVLLPGDAEFRPYRRVSPDSPRRLPPRRLPPLRRNRRAAKRTRWTPSSTRRGTSCATRARTTPTAPSTPPSLRSGPPSTSTPAAPSTP